MPKIFNIDFSATTKINSVTNTNIDNIDYVTYDDDNTNILVAGFFKGFDKYSGGIARIFSGGSIDNTFIVDYGFLDVNDSGVYPIINQIVIDSNNKYYVGGNFTTYKSISANRIIRLNTDGSIDNTFVYDTGFNEAVNILQIQPDGKIVVGGNFRTYKGVSANRIIRLNTDGSIDSTFVYGTGFDSTVNILQIQPDGKIVVGGNFTTYQGVSANRIIRLNTDGSIDSTFVYGTGFNNSVTKIKLDSLGKIVVGGTTFTTYQGVSANRIIRLNTNGSIDSTFVYGTGFNDEIREITIDSSDKIYVGGRFTTYNGATNNRLIKLNNNGSKDTTFTHSFSTSSALLLTSIAIDVNNKVVVGGIFTMYNSNTTVVNNLIRLNSNGSLDNTFDYNGSHGYGQTIDVIKFDNLNNLVIGGRFNSYKEPNALYSLKTYNAKTNTSFNPNYGISAGVLNNLSTRSILKSKTNNIYIGGYFEYYSLLNSSYRAIGLLGLNMDGSPNPAISVSTGANNTVNNIFEDNLGKLFIMGGFTTYKGVSVPRIVKINPDASIDNTFNRAGLQLAFYNTMDFDSSNNIYLGGDFTTFSGSTNNRIIKLTSTGYKDNSFDNSIGFNSFTNKILVDNYGKILVGGVFTTYKGVSANRIIRLNTDGSIDNTFNYGTGFDSTVNNMEMWGDKIYVAGSFTTYKNKPYNAFIRLNYDGSIDETFNMRAGVTNNNINNIFIDSKGNIYLVGYIQYQNYNPTRIIKIKPDGTRDLLFNLPLTTFRRNSASVTTTMISLAFL